MSPAISEADAANELMLLAREIAGELFNSEIIAGSSEALENI